jgi:hypothetical protein
MALSLAVDQAQTLPQSPETAMKTTTLLLAVSVSLVACSKSEPPPPPVAAAQPAEPLPNSNIFSADVKALQRAKDVQKTMDQRKADLDKQLQESEGH